MSSREEFEAWATNEWKFPFVVERSGDSYKFLSAQNKWETWQAATKAMEAKCAALAAENGQMLRLLTNISENHDEYVNQDEYLYAGVPMDYVSEINMYVSRDVEAENPFMATDAHLAEVRAQGVEALVLRRKTAARIARDRDDLRAADALEGEASRAQMFADEIRQEAK